jgi:hypothetical protein
MSTKRQKLEKNPAVSLRVPLEHGRDRRFGLGPNICERIPFFFEYVIRSIISSCWCGCPSSAREFGKNEKLSGISGESAGHFSLLSPILKCEPCSNETLLLRRLSYEPAIVWQCDKQRRHRVARWVDIAVEIPYTLEVASACIKPNARWHGRPQ